MVASLNPNFDSLKMEARQYHMNRDIAKSNIAILKSIQAKQKFVTDRDTGRLTLENNKGIIKGITTTVSRSYNKVFKPSSIVATLQFILDNAKDLQEEFDAVLRNSDGLEQLITTYKANFVFKSIYRDLSAIKDHYIHFATPRPEPAPVLRVHHDTTKVQEPKPVKVEKQYNVLSEEEVKGKTEVNRGAFSKILSDFKHRSEKDLKSLLKNSKERSLKPAPLTRSISCDVVDILKGQDFDVMISKARGSEVKKTELSDDEAVWEDPVEKEKPHPLNSELLQRLEKLSRRCLQQKSTKVQFS